MLNKRVSVLLGGGREIIRFATLDRCCAHFSNRIVMTIVVAQHYIVVSIAHGEVTLPRHMIPALQHVVRMTVMKHVVVGF